MGQLLTNLFWDHDIPSDYRLHTQARCQCSASSVSRKSYRRPSVVRGRLYEAQNMPFLGSRVWHNGMLYNTGHPEYDSGNSLRKFDGKKCLELAVMPQRWEILRQLP